MTRQPVAQNATEAHRQPVVARGALIAFGWVNVVCGVIGLFLPVWPTTIFLLMATWAFSKSSPRFHDWLVNHRVLGPPVQNWHAHGTIPRYCKVLAVSMMSLSVAIVAFATDAPTFVPWIMIAVLGPVAVFIVTRPEQPQDTPRSGD